MLNLVDPMDRSVLHSQPIASIRVWGVGRDNGRLVIVHKSWKMFSFPWLCDFSQRKCRVLITALLASFRALLFKSNFLHTLNDWLVTNVIEVSGASHTHTQTQRNTVCMIRGTVEGQQVGGGDRQGRGVNDWCWKDGNERLFVSRNKRMKRRWFFLFSFITNPHLTDLSHAFTSDKHDAAGFTKRKSQTHNQ